MLNFLEIKKLEPITIVGHINADVDSVVSCILMSKYLDFKGIKNQIKMLDYFIDPNLKDIGIDVSKIPVGINDKDVLFMVDSSYKFPNTIIGCIDHHPSDPNTSTNYINRKSTACAKIIYDLMFEDGYVFSNEEFKYICFALFMDSISFKSSKALEVDHLFAKNVINGEGFDYNWFYKKGLCLNDLEDNLDAICFNGEKEYVVNNYKFNSTYIQVDKDTNELFEQKCIENIRNHMTEDIDFWLYIINNVETNSSKYIIIDKTNAITHIVPKLLSRGTDIVPLVLKELKNIRNLELVQNNYGEIVRKLIDRNLTISTMESCTGGLISSTITDHEGASNILKGAFVTYSNEAKILQGVPEEIINNFGVYSYETALNMAIACQKTYKSNIGIGITGTTGNVDVNNEDSIAGEIYFCIRIQDKNYLTKLTLIMEEYMTRPMIKKTILDYVMAYLSTFVL